MIEYAYSDPREIYISEATPNDEVLNPQHNWCGTA